MAESDILILTGIEESEPQEVHASSSESRPKSPKITIFAISCEKLPTSQESKTKSPKISHSNLSPEKKSSTKVTFSLEEPEPDQEAIDKFIVVKSPQNPTSTSSSVHSRLSTCSIGDNRAAIGGKSSSAFEGLDGEDEQDDLPKPSPPPQASFDSIIFASLSSKDEDKENTLDEIEEPVEVKSSQDKELSRGDHISEAEQEKQPVNESTEKITENQIEEDQPESEVSVILTTESNLQHEESRLEVVQEEIEETVVPAVLSAEFNLQIDDIKVAVAPEEGEEVPTAVSIEQNLQIDDNIPPVTPETIEVPASTEFNLQIGDNSKVEVVPKESEVLAVAAASTESNLQVDESDKTDSAMEINEQFKTLDESQFLSEVRGSLGKLDKALNRKRRSYADEPVASEAVDKIVNNFAEKYINFMEREWTKRKEAFKQKYGDRLSNGEKIDSVYTYDSFSECFANGKIKVQVPFDLPLIREKKRVPKKIANAEEPTKASERSWWERWFGSAD